ncbi:hypothetical protein PFISCL1PPCAC_7220, partial [Pristionchus fissidentatus]
SFQRMASVSRSRRGSPLDEWKRKLKELARTDKIGNVLLKVLMLLDILSEAPLNFMNLEIAADLISDSATETKETDRTLSKLHLKHVLHNYNSLRDCCFMLAEAVEISVRSLIVNSSGEAKNAQDPSTSYELPAASSSLQNPLQRLTAPEIDYSTGEIILDGVVKDEIAMAENDLLHADAATESRLVDSFKAEGIAPDGINYEGLFKVEDMLEQGPSTSFNPMDAYVLPKEEAAVDVDLLNHVKDMISAESQGGTSGLRKPNGYGRQYKCKICEMTFQKHYLLKIHFLSHSGGRPFKCDHCDESFTESSFLEDHKLKHSGIRPYKCDVCSRAYALQKYLDIHYKRAHSTFNADRLTCRNCNVKFGERKSLSTHLLNVHNEKLYKCKLCNEEFDRFDEISDHKLTCK